MDVVSPNLLSQHNATMLRELEKGDLIECPRGAFAHWAVYIGGEEAGGEEVVHLVNDGIGSNVNSCHVSMIGGKSVKKALVERKNFRNVVYGSNAVKNNGKDGTFPFYRSDVIVDRALSKLGEIDYNVLCMNCEHFANWCRYGEAVSEQANTHWARFTAGLRYLVGGAVSFFLARRTT